MARKSINLKATEIIIDSGPVDINGVGIRKKNERKTVKP